jgi:hypothetical protein
MAQVPIAISSNVMVIPVNLSSMSKTFTLPVVSTNQGRMLIFKDYYGASAKSTISLSTIGMDRIERSGVSSMSLSQTFGAWTFMNDGFTKWFLTDVYQNTFPVQCNVSFLPGLWAKFYSITGQPDSNGPVGNAAGGSGANWGSLLTGTFTSGPAGTNGSNTPGPTNLIYYGDQDGFQPVSTVDYAAIYSGFIYSPSAGTIQFRVQTDDGFRLDYNGANAIISWQGQGATDYYSSSLAMPAGYTPILMRWYDTGGPGMSRMWYNMNGAGYNSNGAGVYFYAPSNITQL